MLKKMIHIGIDSIFINNAISQFESIFPKESLFFIDTSYNVEHSKINNEGYITRINLLMDENKRTLINLIEETKLLFCHSLTNNMVEIINELSGSVTIVWIIWGDEMNLLPITKQKHFKPLTLKALQDQPLIRRIYSKFFIAHKVMFAVKNRELHPVAKKKLAFNKIKYGAFFIFEDLLQFTENNSLKIKPMWFSYYNIEDTCQSLSKNDQSKGTSILIGNSADPSNNHLDTLNLLKGLSIQNKKILCPLSYGGSLEYISKVVKKGKELFGDNFKSIDTVVSLSEYNSYLEDCSVVIMNHLRQQAVGNVVTALYLGSKVFLNTANPIYKFLKKEGFVIFSIDTDIKIIGSLDSLSDEDKKTNRELLSKILSKENVLTNLKHEIKKLTN